MDAATADDAAAAAAAATAAAIRDAMEEVRRRSQYKRSWTIDEAVRDMRSGEWERWRRYCRTLEANARLADVDPWHLPQYFTMRKEPNLMSRQTPSGYWKEKEDELTAIRDYFGGIFSSTSAYQGVRRTLEFYEHDHTKTDWVIHEYQLLYTDQVDKSALFLQEDVVIRKVFNKSHIDFGFLDKYLNLIGQRQVNAADGDMMAMGSSLDEYLRKSQAFDHNFPIAFNHNFPMFARTYISMLNKVGLGGCSDAGSGCGEFPSPSGTQDRDDNVWQHFTKINTKDPNVVYAACHRCDRVLRAHSRNGTSHLRRHLETNTCSCNHNPSSTAEDQEILRDLRAKVDLYKKGKEGGVDSPELNASLDKVDPWDVPPRHFTTLLSWETHQGRWEEVKNNNKLTAIRISGQLLVPHYIGLKRILEFHHKDGTKMDWIMLEYYQVDAPTLLLEGCMVFRKVFQIYEDAVMELSKMWDRDDEEEECYNGEREEGVKAFMDTLLHDCLLNEDIQYDQPQSRKRKRSEVWLHFTKIYTTDPDTVYAVCHCCDRCYKGHSKKDGTSHLKRHNKTCSSKRRNMEGMKQSGRLH